MIFYELLNKKNIHKPKPSMLGYKGIVAERDLSNYGAFNFVPDLNDIPPIDIFINKFNEIKKKLSQEEDPLCKKIIENYEDGNSGKYKTAMKCKKEISEQEIIDDNLQEKQKNVESNKTDQINDEVNDKSENQNIDEFIEMDNEINNKPESQNIDEFIEIDPEINSNNKN